MHDKLVQHILEQKYNVSSWKELAREISRRFSIPLEIVQKKRFIPGGRILAALYTDRKVSYVNCTTHAIEDDSIEGITQAIYKVMKVSSRGQGIGVDISILRPKGDPVNNAASSSSGSVSFMYPIEAAMATIGQNGRRGALLFSINGDHPDVLDFIRAKRDGGLDGANLSIKLSNDVAERMFNSMPVPLVYEGQHYGQADLLDEVAQNAWATGDPGLIFWERSQKLSNSDATGNPIVGVNACSETRLAQDDVCVLGSMNLAAYVANRQFNWGLFAQDVRHAIRGLDEVITAEIEEDRSPHHEQKTILGWLRRLGLGFMGLADAIALMGWRYDSENAISFAAQVSKELFVHSYRASIDLAKEKGPYPAWTDLDLTTFPRQGLLAEHDLWNDLRKYGMRNVTTMAIAPTGTISIVAGVSSGLEPVFAKEYKRRVLLGGEPRELDITHPIITPYTQEAHEIDPYARIAMQAAIQQYVDQSCSSTVNLPHNATPNDVKSVFKAAWEAGLTGITVFRDGCRDEQVLNRGRENILDGQTLLYRHGVDKVYVTINYSNEQPYEIFVNGFGQTPADTQVVDGFARLSSHLLRAGMPATRLAEELRQIRCTAIGSVPLVLARALDEISQEERICEQCGDIIRIEEGCESCSCGSRCD